MALIPYHEAKIIIEEEISKYNSVSKCSSDSCGCSSNKREFSISLNKDEAVIKFGVADKSHFYKLLLNVVKKNGDLTGFSQGFSDLCLKNDNMNIWFNDYGTTLLSSYVSINKKGDFSSQDLDLIISSYKIANPIMNNEVPNPKNVLLDLGVTVYSAENSIDWDYLAGYEKLKQELKDTIILPLENSELYKEIAQGTRRVYEDIKPKAVLFEGPPGTGKTTAARIIAGQVNVPLVYVPVNSIMTKWYGESERNLAQIFKASKDLGSSLIFLDEIDSLATSRDKDMHESTRRVLSVLLREIDGFDVNDKTIFIGATNRKNDLDEALLSRFDVSVHFNLPTLEERISIFKGYAKHLEDSSLRRMAEISEGVSGRNIKDICEYSERSWVSKFLRKDVTEKLPSLEEYLAAIKVRK